MSLKALPGLGGAFCGNFQTQDIIVEYNDKFIYPDKVRLNCYYYRHYSFIIDIKMIFCTVLGRKMEYAGEVI